MSLEIREVGEIGRAFKTATAARAGALLVSAQALLFRQAQRVAELATRSRLPAMYGLRHYVEAGGLISYGPDITEIFRRSAVSVDKILKGAKPGDLPIEQPTKFEVVINLQAAKAIGLKVPPAMLPRADEVIRQATLVRSAESRWASSLDTRKVHAHHHVDHRSRRSSPRCSEWPF